MMNYHALFSPTAADSPINFSASQVGPNCISVSWTPAANVSRYQVYWSGGGGADSGNMSVGAEDRTVTITDLTPCLTYDITLVSLSDHLPSPVVAVRVTLGIYDVPDWIKAGGLLAETTPIRELIKGMPGVVIAREVVQKIVWRGSVNLTPWLGFIAQMVYREVALSAGVANYF